VHFRSIAAKLIIGVVVIGVAAWGPTPWSQSNSGGAYAQTRKAPGKKAPRKKAPQATPKPAPKEQVRTPFTAEEQANAVIPGIPDARAWGDSDVDFRRLLPQSNGPWLALSGGGADGAFGAGVIVGWTASGKRPEFALVSGVSIGALIAPYAFLGPSYDAQLRENFESITAADVFEDRATCQRLLHTWLLMRVS